MTSKIGCWSWRPALNAELPRIPNVVQEPLYRAEAHGLELSEDVRQTTHYLQWYVFANYPVTDSLFS